MADTTTNYGLPFPEGGDGVVVHTDIERLAKRVDLAISQDIAQRLTQDEADSRYGRVTLRDVNLDTIYQDTQATASVHNNVSGYPPSLSGFQAYFRAIRINAFVTHQWWVTSNGNIWRRISDSDRVWSDWTIVHSPEVSEVKIFNNQSDALQWEADNGGTALYIEEA